MTRPYCDASALFAKPVMDEEPAGHPKHLRSALVFGLFKAAAAIDCEKLISSLISGITDKAKKKKTVYKCVESPMSYADYAPINITPLTILIYNH